jgi:hypothetical protein
MSLGNKVNCRRGQMPSEAQALPITSCDNVELTHINTTPKSKKHFLGTPAVSLRTFLNITYIVCSKRRTKRAEKFKARKFRALEFSSVEYFARRKAIFFSKERSDEHRLLWNATSCPKHFFQVWRHTFHSTWVATSILLLWDTSSCPEESFIRVLLLDGGTLLWRNAEIRQPVCGLY